MPAPTNNASSVEASVQPSEIPGIVEDLRVSFRTDKTRSRGWRVAQLNAMERMLTEGFDALAESLVRDIGKSSFDTYVQEVSACRGEVYEALQNLGEWMEDEPVGLHVAQAPGTAAVKKDPLGVVLVMGAWNYNILLTLNPLIGAIAAGNCVLVKPGSYSVNSSNVMLELITRYLDQDCIRCVTGNRHVTGAILEQRFDKIFFTGSPFVGKVIAEAAAKTLTPVILELGGKSPVIIDRTSDLAVTARRLVFGAFLNTGQTCVRPDYVLVHAEIADKLINKMVDTIREFYGRDPKRSDWFGRIINDSAWARLNECIEDGKKYIVHGGQRDREQRFIAPTLFDFGTDQAAFESSVLMQDEVFGPLLPILRYTDFDAQVIDFIRERPKPLALYCFTGNSELAERVMHLTSSGAAVINDCVVHLVNSNLPFGGVGDSGMGSYHGKRSFMAFSHEKAVLRRGFALDLPVRYPPFTPFKQNLTNVILHPWVAYHTGHVNEVLSDKKNIALGVLSLYVARSFWKQVLSKM